MPHAERVTSLTKIGEFPCGHRHAMDKREANQPWENPLTMGAIWGDLCPSSCEEKEPENLDLENIGLVLSPNKSFMVLLETRQVIMGKQQFSREMT